MKTITFYSYKGGVGRSLALVNIGTRLAEFGKKVCILDFDLEAPGLHLKFPGFKLNTRPTVNGIVDYVFDFTNKGILQNNIKDYCVDINIHNIKNSISLIPAGNTESDSYWRKLSSINWYELLYENPNAIAFFLNLKEVIKKDLKADFLLIDSRTGISEMSGITLTLLADEIIIFAANNKENLIGAKRIIKSIISPENNIFEKQPKINFVLTRIPFTETPEDRTKEIQLINRINREYLFPEVTDISVIHSDRELEVFEKVKIAYENDDSNTQISIDYLKLFEKITKNDLSTTERKKFKNLRESERLLQIANNTENIHQKLIILDSAIKLNRSNLDLYVNKANILASNYSFDEAIDTLNKIFKLNEAHIPAIKILIYILIQQKKYKEAELKTQFLLSLKPNDLYALLRLSTIYCLTKRYKDAINTSTIIIEQYPENSVGYSCQGNVHRLLKDYDNAFNYTYKALELDSDNIQAVGTLAEIHAEIGNENEFYIHLENALKLNSDFMQLAINDEAIYSKFLKSERFNTIISKYGIHLKNNIDI